MGVDLGALGALWGSTGMPWGPYGGQLGCSGEARCMRNVCGMYAECMRDLAVDSRGAESALKQQRHETQMQGIVINGAPGCALNHSRSDLASPKSAPGRLYPHGLHNMHFSIHTNINLYL